MPPDYSPIGYDVIVIGGGAAGLSAGLWCDELGLKTLLLEEQAEIGGQLLRVYNAIENHLGGEAVNGRAMRDRFAAQIVGRKFEIRTGVQILAIDLGAKQIALANGDQLFAKFLVLATGVQRRRLNIPGETDFEGRGLLESGTRDGSLVAGKSVCVVGGGDAAAENALILGAVAKRVYLVHRQSEFRARTEFLEKINCHPRIKILTETKVLQIIGGERVTGVELQPNDSADSFQIAVDAVLLRIGVEPCSQLFREQLATDGGGYVKINSRGETSVSGVFAIGDLANPLAPTISGAVGTGATAAKVIAARFSGQK